MLIAAEGRLCIHKSWTDKRSSFHRSVSRQNSRIQAPALSVGSYYPNQGSSSPSLKASSAIYCLAASKGGAVNPPELKARERLPRLAVFVSGGGSNLRAIHAAILNRQIQAEVAVVVSDVPHCGGCQYAVEHGIATLAYPASSKTLVNGRQLGVTTEKLIDSLSQQFEVDYVLLAGYLKLIPEELVRVYKRAMLNIHPALLPNFGGKGFYGSKVHQAVIRSGARFSGPTVHFVDEGYDTGPILAQAVVPVSPTDTAAQLAARVLKEEHSLYPYAVSALVDGRITWRPDGVPILWTAS